MEVPRLAQKRNPSVMWEQSKIPRNHYLSAHESHPIIMPVAKTEKLKKERLAPKGKKAHNLSNVAARKTRTLQQPANKSFVQNTSTMKMKA